MVYQKFNRTICFTRPNKGTDSLAALYYGASNWEADLADTFVEKKVATIFYNGDFGISRLQDESRHQSSCPMSYIMPLTLLPRRERQIACSSRRAYVGILILVSTASIQLILYLDLVLFSLRSSLGGNHKENKSVGFQIGASATRQAWRPPAFSTHHLCPSSSLSLIVICIIWTSLSTHQHRLHTFAHVSHTH